MFKYNTFEKIKMFGIIGAASIEPDEIMQRFIPKFDELHFLDPKLAIKKERLIYYSKLF
tara:strand:- start:196 stop:372 length:177 start_codon:yes stop_codon:yes gene_type:complete